jgi:hypothetical protein
VQLQCKLCPKGHGRVDFRWVVLWRGGMAFLPGTSARRAVGAARAAPSRPWFVESHWGVALWVARNFGLCRSRTTPLPP